MSDDRNDLPRDNLFRARSNSVISAIGFTRSTDGEDKAGDGHLVGHFAVFNQWARIDSIFEGTFMERIAPGAFKNTIKERLDQVRVLFNHGHDMQIGEKALGKIESLEEDDQGAAYDVSMFDTSYNRDLIPGLEANQYGASFRFRVMRDEFDHEPKASDANPDAIPERTIKEVQLYEFGPVTFPAYEGASAGIRSITDEMIMAIYRSHPERVAQLLGFDLPTVIKNSGPIMTTTAGNSTSFTITPSTTVPPLITPTPAPAADADDPVTSNARRSEYPRLVVKVNPNKDHERE